MSNLPPRPPPPPPAGSQGGPARTGTPPVGFGPGSSPLTQVRPQPISRTATPQGPSAATSPGPAEAHSNSRSPFVGQPAAFRPPPPPNMPPPPQAGRALSPGGIPTPPSQGPASSYGGSPRPPAPPSQYQNQQYQQQPPMPQQQQQFQQQYPPQQQYQQQQQQQAAPVPPLSPTVSAAAAPSSRRRMYPEQMATAYSAQQQQQQPAQQPQGFQPPYGGGNLPPLPGSAQQQVPQQSGMSQQSDPAIGAGGFFVPGAAQAPAVPSSTGMPPVSAAAAGYPMQSQQQQMPPQQFQPQMQQMQQPMAGVTQQFAQMGLGPSPQEYQVAMLGGQPQLAALDEPAPIIKLPPSAACVPSPHIVCPAKHKRSTLNAVPKTDKLLKKSKLPFGLVITPFKSQEEGEEPMPVVNEIVRCRRCRTYINPFVQFVEGGRRWKCNMCGLNNDVPLFFDYDSATQTQKDRWQRADLNHAVVEFVAPVEYMVRPPMPPVYVFIIDVSYASVQIGAPGVIGQAILDSLDNIPNVDKRTKVAFLAVDTSLHYFQVRPGSTEPQQLVVGDLDDVFLPSPSDLLLNLDECRQGIENLLSRLGSMFKDNHTVGNALSPAINAAQKLLGTLGGKIIVMQASAPTIGEGKVEPRAEGKDLGTPRESDLLRPQNNWYKTLAADCSRMQVAFDTIFFGQQPMDIATVSCLARYTGGSVFYYPSFMATRKPEVDRFSKEFGNHLSAKVGLEAVLRIRASKGLRMASYYGNFFLRSMDLLALPNVTPNHAYAVDVEIDEALTTPVVYFQTALLHTTSYGERRIRVSTLALPTTDNIHTVFHHADQIAIASLLAKKAVDRALVAKLEDAREALQHKALEIIGAFKTECTQSSSGATTQLQIPRSLQLLPLLTLASLKHTSLRSGNNVPPALRLAAMNFVLTLPAEQGVQPFSVARMYGLHNLPETAGYPDPETGLTVLPPKLNLSAESLSPYGVFLLHDGNDSFLWFGREVSPAVCSALLNVSDVRTVPSGVISFPDLSNGADTPAPGFELNFQVNAIIKRLNALCHNLWSPVTYVCKEDGEPVLRMWMMQRLSEDMDTSAPSYQQFLNQLRDKVNRGNF